MLNRETLLNVPKITVRPLLLVKLSNGGKNNFVI